MAWFYFINVVKLTKLVTLMEGGVEIMPPSAGHVKSPVQRGQEEKASAREKERKK